MTVPLLVGVLGSRIGSHEAAQIGYGNRELDLYQIGCIESICDAGMLPLGIASTNVASGLDICDLLSGLVVPHDDRHHHHDKTRLPIVLGALARNLPILAIGSGEHLLADALAGRVAQLSKGSGDEPDASDIDSGDGGSDLGELLGVSSGRRLPVLMDTTNVPSGMWMAARGPDGSVYAVVTHGPAGVQALSIRWDPGSFRPGDQAREGPFRWLRDQAASTRPTAQSAPQEHLSAREEVR